MHVTDKFSVLFILRTRFVAPPSHCPPGVPEKLQMVIDVGWHGEVETCTLVLAGESNDLIVPSDTEWSC